MTMFPLDSMNLISGASESAYFLYPITKGKTENHILNLKFDRTSIYRPGVLIVPEGREEKMADR